MTEPPQREVPLSEHLPAETRRQLGLKYLLDRIVAFVLLVPLLPLMVLIGISIRLVDGKPVFFRQQRAGRDEVPFEMLKFRTMVVNADSLLDSEGRPTKSRVTRTGRFLRSTSLDELPNVVNIAQGDMSFVGPRPTLPEFLEEHGMSSRLRSAVKPGITGLAQVSGRNSIPWKERLKWDEHYVREYSLALDMRILFRSVKVVLLRQGVEIDRNPDANLPRST